MATDDPQDLTFSGKCEQRLRAFFAAHNSPPPIIQHVDGGWQFVIVQAETDRISMLWKKELTGTIDAEIRSRVTKDEWGDMRLLTTDMLEASQDPTGMSHQGILARSDADDDACLDKAFDLINRLLPDCVTGVFANFEEIRESAGRAYDAISKRRGY